MATGHGNHTKAIDSSRHDLIYLLTSLLTVRFPVNHDL